MAVTNQLKFASPASAASSTIKNKNLKVLAAIIFDSSATPCYTVSSLGFSILPKDTSECRLEVPGFKPQTSG